MKTIIPLVIAITAALVTQSIRAQSPSVVMTENSSTSLTVVEGGSTLPSSDVNNTSADHWTVTLPTATDTSANPLSWAEPENPLLNVTPTGWNTITWISSTQFTIVSDTSLGFEGTQNGGTFDVGGSIFGGGGTFYTFTDNSDGAVSTPDTGSTLSLLALALAGLFGASRLRSLRLA